MKSKTNKTKASTEQDSVEIIGIGEVSPHNKAVYEAGKSMLIDSVSTGREFCKSMIATCTGAIPIYLGILTFLLPEKYILGVKAGITVALPAILFLIASVFFTIGYFPVTKEFSLDLISEIERERNATIRHRNKLIWIGFTFFVIGTFMAIVVIVVNIGVR